jgi:hypothetical protein
MTTKRECNLFVIFAREAHQAVIFRCGPSIWTEIILWDTDADTFTEGHWFRGTIDTYLCDVSPDASKMIYTAEKNHKWWILDSATKHNWTAISRPPYLTALAMWANSDTPGGGYFEDDKTVYVALTEQAIQAQNQPLPEGFRVQSLFPTYDIGKYDLSVRDGIYYNLLLEKRGWARIEGDFSWNKILHHYESAKVIWWKDSFDHSYSLLWMMPLSGYDHRYRFRLLRHQSNAEFEVDNCAWADWDQRGRLIYINSGSLFVGNLLSDRIEPVQIADFSANQRKLFPPPAWARTWDQPG